MPLSLLNLPIAFKTRIINTFGEKGQTWLTNLPRIIMQCEKDFNLKIKAHFPNLSFNYTAEAVRADGSSIVVKLCVPSKDVENEINALECMRGDGIVELLASDSKNGILLLEKLTPGAMLSTLENDADATAIAANIMKKLWRPLPSKHNFPTTAQWFERLDKPIELPSAFSPSLIDKAQHIAAELHQDMDELVLLHGDFHHFNILSSDRQPWLAIDPQGVVGEHEFEVSALLRNPIPHIATTMNTKKILANRVDQLSELLNFDRKKVIAWAFAQTVLATVWSVDNKDDYWEHFFKCAKTLSELR